MGSDDYDDDFVPPDGINMDIEVSRTGSATESKTPQTVPSDQPKITDMIKSSRIKDHKLEVVHSGSQATLKSILDKKNQRGRKSSHQPSSGSGAGRRQ